jgi:thioredoxin-related protein
VDDRHVTAITRLLAAAVMAALVALPAMAQQPSPHAIDIPRWFSNSLLDFKDELPEAARDGKRVMVYIGQDGCPYCKALMKTSFAPGPIADLVRRHFVAIAINIWGDAEVTWIDGRRFTEKSLARELKVQFTPTLLFFETDGRLALRLDGYLPPERMRLAVDYLVSRRDREESLADYLAARTPVAAADGPAPAMPYLLRDPTNLVRRPAGKPLAVLFESPGCAPCRTLHAEAFARPGLRAMLRRFDVARLVAGPAQPITTPDGRRTDTRAWSRDLGIRMHPTVIFFDSGGREAFRFDGELRPFHVESAFDYVASGAWQREPQFQRHVQARAERLRAEGKPVDLWK